MRFLLAVRVFVRVLFDGTIAAPVEAILKGESPGAVDAPAPRAPAEGRAGPKAASRNEALTLLATLQREARFVDIIKEPLANYTDAQIGAAARDVLGDCAKVLDRLFALRPLVEQEEGSEVEAPAGFDTGRYRLVGNVHGQPPFRGILAHHGWQATRCELPRWSGSDASARVVAPVELEVK
jgi:hypothetical protein